MEPTSEPEFATQLAARVDQLAATMDGRISVLEQRVAVLERPSGATAPAWAPPAATPVAETSVPNNPVTESPTTPPPPAPNASVPPPPTGPPISMPSPVGPPSAVAARTGPSFAISVEAILRWAGIALVVLAAGFLVSTAIERGWIGPELQLLGATMIGFGLIGGAFRLVADRRPYALALANGGAAVIIVCAGAAHSWLDLYGALTGLLMVAAAAAISIAAAVKLRMESMAVTATLAMLIVPAWAEILVDAPVLTTGVWLGAFAVIVTVVGLRLGWDLFRLVATWSTALWVLGLAIALNTDGNADYFVAGAALVAVVTAVLWLNPTLAARRGVAGDGIVGSTLAAYEHRAAVLVPLWSWGALLAFGGFALDDPGGWIGVTLAVGFAVLALLAGPLDQWIDDDAVASHLLGAGLLFSVAVVAWVGGPTLVVVIAGQALATVILAGRFGDLLLRLYGYALAAVAWLLLAVGVGELIDLNQTLGSDHLAYGAVVAALGAIAWLAKRTEVKAVAEPIIGVVWLAGLGYVASLFVAYIDDRWWLTIGGVAAAISVGLWHKFGGYVGSIGLALGVATIVATVGSIVAAAEDGASVAGHVANLSVVVIAALATAWMWLAEERLDVARPLFIGTWALTLGWLASVLIAAPQGQVQISAVWAVAAAAAIVAGIRTGEVAVRSVGLGTLGVVLVKLFTVDLAEVDTLWRVGLFLVVGLGLLRLGYRLPALAEKYGDDDAGGPNTAGEETTEGGADAQPVT